MADRSVRAPVIALTSGFGEDPDVAVADGVAVVLEVDGAGGVGFFDGGGGGAVGEFDVVLDDGAVVGDGEAGVGGFVAGGVVLGGGEVDVVGLPGEGREAEVLAGGGDFVEAAAFVVFAVEAEAVEHLDFVAALEVDAAVAAGLAPGVGHEREAEFDVGGEALELVFAGDAFHEQAVLGDAGFGEAVDAFAVEEDGGAGRRWGVFGGGGAVGAGHFEEACALAVEDFGGVGRDFGAELFVGGFEDDFADGVIAAAEGAGHGGAVEVPAVAGEAALVGDGFEFAFAQSPDLDAPAFVFDGGGELALDGEVGVFFGGFFGGGVAGELGLLRLGGFGFGGGEFGFAEVFFEEGGGDVDDLIEPGLAHPEGVGGLGEGVEGGFDTGGLEFFHHFGAADFESVAFAFDEEGGGDAGADVGDGGGGDVEGGFLGVGAAEEGDGVLAGFVFVGGSEVLGGGHDDGGLDSAGLVEVWAGFLGVGDAGGHGGEAGEVAAGGAADAADAGGVDVEFGGFGAEGAEGGFDVLDGGGVFGFLGEAVGDEGGDEAALGEAFHHGFVAFDLALLPAAAMNVEDAGVGAGFIGDVDEELDGVFRVGGDVEGFEGEAGGGGGFDELEFGGLDGLRRGGEGEGAEEDEEAVHGGKMSWNEAGGKC